MPIDVTAEILIHRERPMVAAFVMDPKNDTAWIGGITEVATLTAPPIGPGTRVARVARFLGRRVEYVNEIIEYAPPTRLAMRSVQGPFPMAITYEFDAADGGTRVRPRVAGAAEGFYRLAAPLLAGAVRRSIVRDLHAPRACLASNGP